MRARTSAENDAPWHQQGESKLPQLAGTQALGPPHSGQSRRAETGARAFGINATAKGWKWCADGQRPGNWPMGANPEATAALDRAAGTSSIAMRPSGPPQMAG